MTQVRRYPLRSGRELRVVVLRGHVIAAVHDSGVELRRGIQSITLNADELDTVRSALADAAGETGSAEATDSAQVRRRPDLGESR